MITETQPDAAWQLEKQKRVECYEASARMWRDIAGAAQRAGNHDIVIIAHGNAMENENKAEIYRNNPKKENV